MFTAMRSHDHDRMRTLVRILVPSLVAATLPAIAATPATAGTQTFTGLSATARSAHSWTVPTGVDRVSVTLVGGSGANGASSGTGASGGSGGRGASVTATLNVLPGDVLHIGLGANGSGGNGGESGESANNQWSYGSGGSGDGSVSGGGGGGSSIIEVSRGADITPALLAGGGGGGGSAQSVDGTIADGGAGGAAGGLAFGALPVPSSGDGGNKNATAGGAASDNAGGSAGVNGGSTGSMWTGGNAGEATFGSTGGGGGGAGRYGGGGGGGSSQFVPGEESYAAGGGGGGTSWLSDGAATALYPLWTNANELVGTAGGTQARAQIDYVAFSTTSLPVATIDTPYSTTVAAVFGSATAPDQWSVSPALPSGLTLNASNGAITGTPTGSTSTGTYTITATATSVYGIQARSSVDLALDVITVPGTPTIGSASAADGQATVTFTAPASNGGSPITSYTVTSSPGNITATGASSPIIIGGLSNGTAYSFRVTARNIAGAGSASGTTNTVTPVSTGGGGDSGGSSGGSAARESASQANMTGAPSPSPTPSETNPPAPTGTTNIVQKSAAVIPGLSMPRRIIAPGRTVLVPRTLRTADGTRVLARAAITRWAPRQLTPRNGLGARIERNKAGRITVVTSGTRAIIVTLILTAPESATAQSYRIVKRWRVPAAR